MFRNRKIRLIIVATIISLTSLFTLQETALADHGFDTLEVNECQAWRHVLETDDQLYLCRYNGEELPHVLPSVPVGANGIVLRIEDVGGIIRAASVPFIDKALGAIYFTADDAAIPTWADATIRMELCENPSIFVPFDCSAENTPEFATTTDLDTTRDDITETLPRIMLRLEVSDTTIQTEEYTVGTGITAVGKVLVVAAFEPLQIISASAFVLATSNAGGDFTAPAEPGFVTTIRTTGLNSVFTQGVISMGDWLGIPPTMTIIVFLLGLYLLLVWVLFRLVGRESSPTWGLWIQPFIMIGGFMGGTFLFELGVIVAAFQFIFGVGMFINRHIGI